MYTRVVVPFSGGEFSAGALRVAAAVAHASAVPIHLVSFGLTASHTIDLEASARDAASEIGNVPVVVKASQVDDIVAALAKEVLDEPGALVCMRSVGRAHAQPVLGSYAESVLREIFGPILLVGPQARVDGYSLAGDIVVASDGSATAKAVQPIASQWAISYHLTPFVVSVSPATKGETNVAAEVAHVAHEAKAMERDLGRAVAYDVLHSKHPADAIVEFARSRNAAAIAMATHGESGLRRLALGSVTMAVVHKAHCPVLVHRPPHTH